jgi:hypothetical protein
MTQNIFLSKLNLKFFCKGVTLFITTSLAFICHAGLLKPLCLEDWFYFHNQVSIIKKKLTQLGPKVQHTMALEYLYRGDQNSSFISYSSDGRNSTNFWNTMILTTNGGQIKKKTLNNLS